MIAGLLAQGVPFTVTAGIRVLEAAAGRGRAQISNSAVVQDQRGTLHAAATFAVAEAASSAAVLSALADRLAPDGGRSALSAVVADADITYWRCPQTPVVATASIDHYSDAAPTAEDLLRERNVSVTVALADPTGRAVGRAAFHWVVTTRDQQH